jgi:hypothetical protein
MLQLNKVLKKMGRTTITLELAVALLNKTVKLYLLFILIVLAYIIEFTVLKSYVCKASTVGTYKFEYNK